MNLAFQTPSSTSLGPSPWGGEDGLVELVRLAKVGPREELAGAELER